ncbi:dihydropteroate synthase [Gracilibacillus oryzae]|uniref:Dihydropteroate synthase n=1 Tax=Gracilibacillus oryzae TaxID=1672701 RepID=A0A7C8GQT4_9BACI|nr:dihydropteroate synthase [Gracilibacillus oryzae]KAB8126414.1 dihydropteroate synthase [Gracilibacillus oryzae]
MSEWLRTKIKDFHYSKQTLIMGILNVTPDSFSDGGNYVSIDHAIAQAKKMEREGAHIIDIGGESTRPGHQPVSEQEEIERVVPVIEAISREVDLPVSIDTYKAEVAKQAVKAGASIINDVWGAKKEPAIAKVAAAHNVPIILMHNRREANYQSFVEDMLADVKECVQIAIDAGVTRDNIIVDPGIGFAKNYEQNILAMQNLDKLKQLGYPVLLATSRKSVIGQVLDLPVDQRDEGTGATVCFGITKGVELVRVHNVEMAARMARMMDALIDKGSERHG